MGSAQSYISSEAALTTLAIAGAIGLGYVQLGHGSISTSAGTSATPQADKPEKLTGDGKKKKKQAKSSVALSGDISDKVHPHTNNPSRQYPSKTFPDPERDVNAVPSFPGQFESTPSPDPHLLDMGATAASSSVSKAKKSKKKKPKAAVTTDPIVQDDVAASSSADYSATSTKSRTKSAKRQQQPQSSSSSQMTRPLPSTTSIDTDGSWTRIGSIRRQTPLTKTSLDVNTSDVDTGLTSQTGNSSPIAERSTEGEDSSSFLLDIVSRESNENHRRTLAEKLLPKPRKTAVDDMLETPDHPTLARVIRVQPHPDEKPASGFSWGDYEDVRVTTDGGENDADGEDDGWGVVKTRRQTVDRASASTVTSSSHHQIQKASETMTKRQRQNAQRRENEKTAKAEAESQRLAVLAKHKRELEKVKILEQYGGKSGGKSSSGGMRASVDDRGKLVWE